LDFCDFSASVRKTSNGRRGTAMGAETRLERLPSSGIDGGFKLENEGCWFLEPAKSVEPGAELRHQTHAYDIAGDIRAGPNARRGQIRRVRSVDRADKILR
jgi:hypothetical protein